MIGRCGMGDRICPRARLGRSGSTEPPPGFGSGLSTRISTVQTQAARTTPGAATTRALSRALVASTGCGRQRIPWPSSAPRMCSRGDSWKQLPTALGRNTPGRPAASACWAFQLVQCAGTTTAGVSAASAVTVLGMMSPSRRWKPAVGAVELPAGRVGLTPLVGGVRVVDLGWWGPSGPGALGAHGD